MQIYELLQLGKRRNKKNIPTKSIFWFHPGLKQSWMVQRNDESIIIFQLNFTSAKIEFGEFSRDLFSPATEDTEYWYFCSVFVYQMALHRKLLCKYLQRSTMDDGLVNNGFHIRFKLHGL